MLAFRIVEQRDLFKNLPSCVFAGRVGPTPDPLALQQLEEALRNSVVVTVASSAHAGFQVVLAKERMPFPAGELGALIEMYGDLPVRLSSPDRHQQDLQCQVRCHTGLC